MNIDQLYLSVLITTDWKIFPDEGWEMHLSICTFIRFGSDEEDLRAGRVVSVEKNN